MHHRSHQQTFKTCLALGIVDLYQVIDSAQWWDIMHQHGSRKGGSGNGRQNLVNPPSPTNPKACSSFQETMGLDGTGLGACSRGWTAEKNLAIQRTSLQG